MSTDTSDVASGWYERMRGFVASRSAPVQGLVMGAMFGLSMAVWDAIQSGSVVNGIVGGLLAGLLFGVVMGLVVGRRSALDGSLTSAERRTVVASVRSGEAVDDPTRAPAVIDYAAKLRRSQPLESQSRWVFGVFLVLSLALAVSSFANGHVLGGFGWLAITLFWGVLPRRVRRTRERDLAQAAAAEGHARDALGLGPTRPSAAGVYDPQNVPPWTFWILYGVIAVPASAALLLVLASGEWTAGVGESVVILVLALIVPLALPWSRYRRTKRESRRGGGGSVL